MRYAIPEFSNLIKPLHELLESQYMLQNIRQANRSLSAWRDEHETALTYLIDAIKNQAILANPDRKKRLCLFTDASEPNC